MKDRDRIAEAQERVDKELGARLKVVREWRGVRQEDLARRVRLSRPQVSNIENGVSGLTLWSLLRFAAALRVQPYVFLYPDEMWRRFFNDAVRQGGDRGGHGS